MCNKRLLTFLAAGCYYFFSGLEFAVIIPTLNLFIKRLGGDQSIIGFCVAAMSFTGLFSAPLFGRITDFFGKTKVAVIVADIFAIGGNIMYFASTTPYMVIGSRLIVGVADGVGSSILGMLTCAVEREDRTRLLSRIFAGRQAGVLFGPALNFFLIFFCFKFIGFKIDNYTAPGFFMAILWIIHLIITIFCYHDLDPASNSFLIDPDRENTRETSTETYYSDDSKTTFWQTVYQDLLSEKTILVIFSGFVLMFVFNGMETITTPLSLKFFGWKEIANSIYGSATGLVYVVSLISLSFTSKIFSDRFLLLIGIIVLTCDNLLYLLFVIFAIQQPDCDICSSTKSYPAWMLALFITYGALLSLAMQYALVPSISMFSKITSEKNRGFNQGVFLTFRQMGRILGPLWGANLLDNDHLPLLIGVFFGLFFLVLVMNIVSYKRLPCREDDDFNITYSQSSVETGSLESSRENTPLLHSNSN